METFTASTGNANPTVLRDTPFLKILAHTSTALGQYLKCYVAATIYDLENFVNVIDGNVFVKQITHGAHEAHGVTLLILQRFGKLLWMQGKLKTIPVFV